MKNVIECHTGEIRHGLQPVYNLSKCSGGVLNFDRGEKLNPKNLKGKLWKYKVHRGN